jgi:predicted nucleic acid-binding protein
MIVLDTNIIGTFARVGALDLIASLFNKDEIGVASAVYAELVAGVREGRDFLQTTVDLIEKGTFRLLPLTAEEVVERVQLPASLDGGEAESIIICMRRGAAFLTNDKRARNFCRSAGVQVFDLVEVLRSLWRLGVMPKRRVRKLVTEIERQENLVIKNKEQIFDD